jgi:hypothetical protein
LSNWRGVLASSSQRSSIYHEYILFIINYVIIVYYKLSTTYNCFAVNFPRHHQALSATVKWVFKNYIIKKSIMLDISFETDASK